jgi:hypothetical protein
VGSLQKTLLTDGIDGNSVTRKRRKKDWNSRRSELSSRKQRSSGNVDRGADEGRRRWLVELMMMPILIRLGWLW